MIFHGGLTGKRCLNCPRGLEGVSQDWTHEGHLELRRRPSRALDLTFSLLTELKRGLRSSGLTQSG